MFQPLECFIGLRYLRSRERRRVVSFMSAASLGGIALGVAALIVILSVMNGFENELRTRLLSMSSQASVSNPVSGIPDWQSLRTELRAEPGVVAVAPYVLIEGMLAAGANRRPAIVRGIVPELETAVSDVARVVGAGALESLEPGSDGIVLGRVLALNLGVDVGDRVALYVPKMLFDPKTETRRLLTRPQSFRVAGIFEAGIQDHDSNLALIGIDAASALEGMAGRPEGLALAMSDPMDVTGLGARLRTRLPAGLKYSDWTIEHRSYFHAIRIEKVMMTIILMLIVGVAAFNIVASLMMVVTDKERDIAILRTCGMEPARVARVFLVQGSLIGIGGTLLGTALGLIVAFNIGTIVPWLEQTFHFQIMPGDVYYVTEIPADVHLFDVVSIPVMALIVAALATVYPSRRAALVAPAQALRYE